MTARIVFRISVVALLVYSAVTQKCPASGTSESSIFGWMLRGHVYDTILAELPFACVFKCREDNRCQSLKAVFSKIGIFSKKKGLISVFTNCIFILHLI